MPSTAPEPFPDLDLPPRTSKQIEHDHDRNEEQVTFLAPEPEASASASSRETGPGELFETLVERRRSESEAVQFEILPTVTDQGSLVVPSELFVRRPDANGELSPTARDILDENFVAQEGDEGSTLCDELARGLIVYRYVGDEESKAEIINGTIQQLQGQEVQVKASPHLVTALQQHAPTPPPKKVVAKAAVGPAPTRVDMCDVDFRWAGFRPPVGETIVAVIDTGIANVAREDGWLKEVARTRENIDPLDEFPHPGNEYLDFAAGHGTFAAGIVRLVDPDAQIRVYRALDSDGFATESDVACAMIRAARDGAHVLNLSNGMHTVDNEPSVAFQIALEVIGESNVAPVVVASAGNYGTPDPVWPAAFASVPGFNDWVISVAALTKDLQEADWSSHGDWVTCSCVGEGIVSTFVPGNEDPEFSRHHPQYPAPDHYPLPGQFDVWAVWSGTSFAAPQIAGAISRTMREKGLAPRAASQELIGGGTPIQGYGKSLRLPPGT